MRQKSVPAKEPAEQVVKNIRRATRHGAEQDQLEQLVIGKGVGTGVAKTAS